MPSADQKPRTLYDKVFRDHVVNESQDGTVLLYIGTFNDKLMIYKLDS